MRRKIIALFLAIAATGLTGCGNGTDNEASTANTEQASSVQHETQAKDRKDRTGQTEQSEVGKSKIVHQKKGIGDKITTGPFDIELTDAQIMTLEPSPDFKQMFGGKDKVTAITLALKSENKSENTNSIYLNQGTITTNTKEQKQADLLLSDDVGGDYIGNIEKNGQIYFILDSPAEEINSVTFTADAPHDENFSTIGEKVTFTVNFDK
ncbi:hypothetical protein [Peptococcus simiae]|uniref:hypothetical protein n=1 Tax=Peptococcus simiae TaxID=1643805 RepID=UPI0039817B10